MDLGQAVAGRFEPAAGPGGGAPRRSPAHHSHVRTRIADHLDRRDVMGDQRDPLGPQPHHGLVVVGLVADVAAAVGLLDAPDAVHQIRRAGDGPGPHQSLVAPERPEDGLAAGVDVVGPRGELDVDDAEMRDVGDAPGLAAVGQVAVGQQDHRGAVLDRDADRLNGREEAVGGALGRDDGQGRLAVAAVHGHQQVGGLGLGGQAGGGAATLDVDHHQRQFETDGQTHGLGLEGHSRTRGGGDADVAPVGRAQSRSHRGDLILGLQRADPEVLVAGEFVEDVAGRRDRVRPQEQRYPGQLGGGDQPPGQRGVAVDVGVGAGIERRGGDHEPAGSQLGGLAEGVAGREGGLVGRDDGVAPGELAVDPVDGGLDRTRIQPGHQPKREEVLGALGVPGLDPQVLAGPLGEIGHGRGDHRVAVEGAVFEWVGLVSGLGQVALVEGVGVDDHGPARLQQRQVGLQRGRVHGHQNRGGVAGSSDVVVRDVDLERRDAGQCAGRGPDLCRELRQRGQVVAEQGAGRGEPVPGELHPVAGVTGETKDDPVGLADLAGPLGNIGH